MPKQIYLFKEHENFVAGKSRLRREVVRKTNYIRLSIALLIGLGFLWGAGAIYRGIWRRNESVEKIVGTVISCEKIENGSHIQYSFPFNGQNYTHQAYMRRSSCDSFPIDSQIDLYYSNGRLNSVSPYHPIAGEWTVVLLPLLVGGFILLVCFALILGDRHDLYKYHRLQRKGILLEGNVIMAMKLVEKQGYYRMYYRFLTPNGTYIEGLIDNTHASYQPEALREGDTLQILYLDDETYCVL